jgi:hypothetical protein
VLAEDVRGQPVAEEGHAARVVDVDGVDEAATLLRHEVAHLAEDVSDPRRVGGEGLGPVERVEVVVVLAGDPLQRFDLPGDGGDVLVADADAAPFAEAFVGDRRQPRPGDDDAIAEARRRLDELLVQPRPERQHQADGHRPPHDAEDREEGAQLLGAHIAEELP